MRLEQLAESLHGIAFPSPAVPSTPTAACDAPSDFDDLALKQQQAGEEQQQQQQLEEGPRRQQEGEVGQHHTEGGEGAEARREAEVGGFAKSGRLGGGGLEMLVLLCP